MNKNSAGAQEFTQFVNRFRAAVVARKLEVDESNVRSWAKGKRRPSEGVKAKIAEHFGVEVGRWNEPPDTGQRTTSGQAPVGGGQAPVGGPPLRRAVDGTTESLQADILERINQLVTEANDAKSGASVRDRAALFNAATSAVRNLSRLRGEDQVTRARILASGAWRELNAALVAVHAEVLKAHPELLRAIQERLAALDAEQR